MMHLFYHPSPPTSGTVHHQKIFEAERHFMVYTDTIITLLQYIILSKMLLYIYRC